MAAQPAFTSVSAYLANESASEVRHEYVAGTVYAMAGGSRNHVQITKNLVVLLDRLLGEGKCENLGQDLKVWVEQANSYYYPDASVSCPPHFIDESNGVIDNPTALFEVLSPSTSIFDNGAKFAAYRALNSLRDYVLIESDSPSVRVFSLEQGEWGLRSYSGLDAVAILPSLEVQLPLTELYRRAQFAQ